MDRLRVEFPPAANGNHPAAQVLQMGSSEWSPTMSDEFLRSTTHNEEHFQLTKMLGFQSYVVVPIVKFSTDHWSIDARVVFYEPHLRGRALG